MNGPGAAGRGLCECEGLEVGLSPEGGRAAWGPPMWLEQVREGGE